MNDHRRIRLETCFCLALGIAVLSALPGARPGNAAQGDVGRSAAPSHGGIDWKFEADNPSAEALIGFRKLPRRVEAVLGSLLAEGRDLVGVEGTGRPLAGVAGEHLEGVAAGLHGPVDGPIDATGDGHVGPETHC